MAKKNSTGKTVETLKHDEATRKNIPTAEYQSVMQKNEQDPMRVPTSVAQLGSTTRSSAATATSTRNSSGAARTSRTGPISSSTRRRSTSRRRSTPRC